MELDNDYITLGVIGTAGRDPGKPLSNMHFNFMCDAFNNFIESHPLLKNNKLIIYSGGSAWADHVVVDTYLKNLNRFKLNIYIPCPIVECDVDGAEDSGDFTGAGSAGGSSRSYRFVDTGQLDWYKNPGQIANLYHQQFQSIMHRDSIKEIVEAKEKGAILDSSSHGFHHRNIKISKADILLSFTFGEDTPELGGYAYDTWIHSKSTYKYHISLAKLTARS